MSNTKKLIAVSAQPVFRVRRRTRAAGQRQIQSTRADAQSGQASAVGGRSRAGGSESSRNIESRVCRSIRGFSGNQCLGTGTDERKQALAAVHAAKDAGVQHFIWSTLPNVEAISRGRLGVAHFTDKALSDRIVSEAGFAHHTFVIAPFFYQNLLGVMAPQKQADGAPVGRCHSIRTGASFTWATSPNSARS